MAEIMSVDFSPFDQNLLVTCSNDKTVAIWDARNIANKLFSFKGHKDEVQQVKFSKIHQNLIASSSLDRRVIIWDIARIEKPQTEAEKKDGPPEMLFMHGGHQSKISDISWNYHEKLVLATVDETNILQVWQMAYEIYYESKQ